MKQDIVIEFINIHKAFGPKKVHQGVSLQLKRGEMMGLFGGSGTGKSVLIRSIIGLEKPDQGQILYKDQDLTQLKERELTQVRTQIGYVFQNGALFDSMSVEENLAYPLRAHTKLSESQIKERIEQMLALIDMKGTNHLLPNELSGGMQKRAGLARATILEPEVILYDEPTAGLDPINTKRLIENCKKLKSKGTTGIFVTHDIPAAFDLCDRIAILKDGKIYVVDTPEQLKTSQDPFIKAFIHSFEKETL
jgi:phospholipid/cholesterol/gamma-HCH transport system ATP-binding protein